LPSVSVNADDIGKDQQPVACKIAIEVDDIEGELAFEQQAHGAFIFRPYRADRRD
jgi:hypothetical protein